MDALRTFVLAPLVNFQQVEANGGGHLGVLLTGPTGTGKTSMAMALGAHIRGQGLGNFFAVSCTDVLSKVVGESEAGLARLFAKARKAQPCVLFLDHLEALAPKRGFDSSSEQSMDRLLSVLLVEMDGILGSGRVTVIGATQNSDFLDAAILRRGRLDVHLTMPVPESVEDTRAVLSIALRHTQVQGDKAALLDRLAVRFKGQGPAHLVRVCQEACMEAIRRGEKVLKEDFFGEV